MKSSNAAETPTTPVTIYGGEEGMSSKVVDARPSGQKTATPIAWPAGAFHERLIARQSGFAHHRDRSRDPPASILDA